MDPFKRRRQPVPFLPTASNRLGSWKAIAAYLDTSVRTVQRWERNEELPVHRHQHIAGGTVYAYRSELDAWWESRRARLEEETEPAQPAVPPVERGPRRKLVWAAAMLGVLVIAAFATWRHLSVTAPPVSMKAAPLTRYPGAELHPTFSPDGSQVAFSWNGEEQDNADIYVRMIAGERSLRLTTDPAWDAFPKWSPDGSKIAFLRKTGLGAYTALLISPLGGAERRLADVKGAGLAWTPDGKWLAIVDGAPEEEFRGISLLSVSTGEKRILTKPPRGTWKDQWPAISPDGKYLAFVRFHVANAGELHVAPTGGGIARPLTRDDVRISGLAWTPDSREIVFSSNRLGSRSLWRIAADGASPSGPERVRLSDDAESPAIHRGPPAKLAFQRPIRERNIWRMELLPSGRKANPPSRIIASTATDWVPRLSADGKRVVFVSDRSGHREIWVSGIGGSSPVQLTSFGGPPAGSPRWSPDGSRIVFDAPGHIYIIGAAGGTPRRLTREFSAQGRASWSWDGRWIYFHSKRTGNFEIWKAPSQGGKAIQVTRSGGREPIESPDGRLLYYVKSFESGGLWSVPVEGGEESLVLEQVKMGYWGVADNGIYYVDFGAAPSTAIPKPVMLFSFEKRQTTNVGTIDGLAGLNEAGFSVSRDGRSIIWTRRDRNSADLILVEGFR